MEENYCVDPLKSFFTVAFPNSGFTNPAYAKNFEKRRAYAQRVLYAFESKEKLESDRPCTFSGLSSSAISFDIAGKLPPGRCFRQHIPLLTGEGFINFFPYGDCGLPVSGSAMLVLQAFPLGCAKVNGKLLAVHSDSPALMLNFAQRFLTENRQKILAARAAGESHLPEGRHKLKTLMIQILLDILRNKQELEEDSTPVSITAYHFTNSGQGASLDIFHIPIEIMFFLQAAVSAAYSRAWGNLCKRGWEITKIKRGLIEAESPRFNVVYEDLFNLPEDAVHFIRTYFRPVLKGVGAQDPRSGYSILGEAGLVSWSLTELFLRKVMKMDRSRIEEIRLLGDRCSAYVLENGDRKFFYNFLTARNYNDLRILLIQTSVSLVKSSLPPLVNFDGFIEVFEEFEGSPHVGWRLARDLILIRMVEQLYEKGWIQSNKEILPSDMELIAEKEEKEEQS